MELNENPQENIITREEQEKVIKSYEEFNAYPRCDWHTHTHKSNILSRDSTNSEAALIDKALDIGLKGIGITDHANLSAHIKCIQHIKNLKSRAEKDNNQDLLNKLDEFKLGLGTEIYLVDRETINHARENNEPTKFYHLILIAKNYEGYRAIAKLSSVSWEERFFFRGFERMPTYVDYFFEWAKENAKNVIVSSACLGSTFAGLVLKYLNLENDEVLNQHKEMYQRQILEFVQIMKSFFGDDFYIELQPSYNIEQIEYNKIALEVATITNTKTIFTTDAHYLDYSKKKVHEIFLRSQNADREVEAFYSSTYLMDGAEMRSYTEYIDEKCFKKCLDNSFEISSKIESFDLNREIKVPPTNIKLIKNHENFLNNERLVDREMYPYIFKYCESEHEIDRILIQQIELGLVEKNIEINEEVLNRLNVEMEALWEISEKLHQRMASYYLLTKELVELMWKVSLVGVSRGSAGAFYITYLLDICQINPIESEFDLPYWRHIDRNKIELADIDIDTESGQRSHILQLVKDIFGEDNVLNIGTFKTEATASAIQTACRGMGIALEEATYMTSLIIDGMSIKECVDAYKEEKQCENFINELLRHEGLLEACLDIEGLCCGRSSHASGVYIMEEPYWNRVAMMKTPKGLPVTQYDMADSDYQGCLKLDFLTIEALDCIRKTMELMIKDGVIEWQGSLKATYDKYLHPDTLNLEDEEYYNIINSKDAIKIFQYSSPQGQVALNKIKPQTFQEICDGNALMRLSCDGEQPIDRYVKHKQDITLWYKEMKETGLTQEEIEVLKKHLLKSYGVAPTQESVMRLSMDSKIANFTLVEANKLRKAIAKAKAKYMIKEVHELFIAKGIENGNREIFLNYVWESFIVPQLG